MKTYRITNKNGYNIGFVHLPNDPELNLHEVRQILKKSPAAMDSKMDLIFSKQTDDIKIMLLKDTIFTLTEIKKEK